MKRRKWLLVAALGGLFCEVLWKWASKEPRGVLADYASRAWKG